jgi:hypothetical protein
MDSFWFSYYRINEIVFMTFAEEILNEKPVICFDKLLFIRSVIRDNEDTKESS